MTQTSDEGLALACERLKGAADDASAWEWDGRFDAGLLSFERSRESFMLELLDEVFDKIWSIREVKTGPDDVLALVRSLGGLRSGQMLLTVNLGDGGPTLWCAWWPWGSGARISIRVGVLTDAESEASAEATLRAAFGV